MNDSERRRLEGKFDLGLAGALESLKEKPKAPAVEIPMTLTEADLENLIDTVQDSISWKNRWEDDEENQAYAKELTELRDKLLKIRARHQRNTYSNV